MPTPQYHRASTRRRRRGTRSPTASGFDTHAAKLPSASDEEESPPSEQPSPDVMPVTENCALLQRAPDDPDNGRDEPTPALLTRRPRRR